MGQSIWEKARDGIKKIGLGFINKNAVTSAIVDHVYDLVVENFGEWIADEKEGEFREFLYEHVRKIVGKVL
jgi:hypothetical protein